MVMIFAIHQHELAIGILVSPALILNPTPTSLPTLSLEVVPEQGWDDLRE